MSCSATPLFSPTGELLGTLDIGANVNSHHDYLLPMLTMASACLPVQASVGNDRTGTGIAIAGDRAHGQNQSKADYLH